MTCRRCGALSAFERVIELRGELEPTPSTQGSTSSQVEQEVEEIGAVAIGEAWPTRAERERRTQGSTAQSVEEARHNVGYAFAAWNNGQPDAVSLAYYGGYQGCARRVEEALDALIEAVRGENASLSRPHVVMPSPGAWLDWRPVGELTDEELERQSQDTLSFVSGGAPTGTLAMEEHSKVLGRGFAIDAEIRRRAALGAPGDVK